MKIIAGVLRCYYVYIIKRFHTIKSPRWEDLQGLPEHMFALQAAKDTPCPFLSWQRCVCITDPTFSQKISKKRGGNKFMEDVLRAKSPVLRHFVTLRTSSLNSSPLAKKRNIFQVGIIFYCGKIYVALCLQIFVQFSNTKYGHNIVPLSPPSTSRTFSSLHWNSVPLNSSPLFCPQLWAPTLLLPTSRNLATLGTSCRWNPMVFALLYLTCFTQPNIFKFYLYPYHGKHFLIGISERRRRKIKSHGKFCSSFINVYV